MRDIGFSSGVFRTLVLALIIGVGIGCSPDSGTGHPGDDLGTVDTSVDPDGFRTKDVPRWTDLVDTGDTGTAELSPDWTTPDQAHETGTPYDMADTEAVDAPLDEDLDSLEDPDLDDDTGDIEDLSGQETNDIGPDPCQNNSCAVHGESCDEGTSPAWSECEDGNWVIRCRCAPASCKPVCKGAGQVQGWYDGCSGELLALAPCLDCSAMCADGFGWQEDCGNASGEILLEGDCASYWQCDPEAANQCGSCDTRADCLGFLWPEDCPGTWECIGHSCVAQCDETNCGNGVCDTQLGETSQSCPDDCSPCPSGTFGPSCAACPGPADLPCWGRGLCDDGLSGSGICQCSSGFTGDACQSCLPGRFGPTCEPCPGGVVLPCSGHGVCDEGLQGSGLCVCTSGFGGAACQDCAPGHWGPQCMECPGGAVLSCSGHGVCSDGISGTGECSCHDGFGGPLCDQQALVVPDVTGKTLAQALALLRDSGLDDVVTLTDSFADVPAGTVASQLPLGGSIVSPGTQVTVTVSLGDGTQEVLPDPASVAPPLDSAVPWDFTTAVGFLIHGPIPLQRDVDPEALEPHRFALLQGRVLDGNGLAIPGVRVSVVHHPGLGYTLSRADGRFDLVLHGGGPVTVALRRDGYLTSHRLVNIEWAGATRLDDVILVSLDPVVTSVDLGAGPAMVSGSMVTDADGVRTARLFFEGGTEASMILPSGDSVPLSTLNVRATEYSQGESGQARMPADLPSLTAYTYCLELTVDEALSAQATTVQFSKPLYHYVENFLDFPVGSAVPVGYYDRVTAQWVASENGRVIQILGIDNGAAVLDLEGDGLAADESTLDELGVTPQELQSLAGSYAPGQSLWRTPIQHFTPWDCNWPYGPPEDALHPRQGRNPFRRHQQRDNRRAPDCKEPAASTINMVNQSLAEHIEVAGTGLSLHYDSGRVAHESDYTLDIEVIGPQSHPDMVSAILFITVAGRAIRQTFPPTPNTDYTFVWDGLDEYGRRVQGKVEATVKIGYTYVAQYYPTSRSFARSFARLSASGASATAQREGAAWAGEGGTREVAPPLVTVWGTFSGTIGAWDNSLTGLGGWALDVHHAFDRRTGKLYKGDGSVHDAEPLGDIIDTVGCAGSAIPPPVNRCPWSR